METFIDRLRTEEHELSERVNKLQEFTETDKFNKPSFKDRDVLEKQLGIMKEYLKILKLRLNDFHKT